MQGKIASKIIIEAPARILKPNEVWATDGFNIENIDIQYIGFTLCHEGSNNNGDRFTLAEMKTACPTIRYKPINWEHEEPNVGVVLDAALKVSDEAGASENIRQPAQIDCVGTIWKTRYPEYANLIEESYNDGDLKVSMEAYFTGVDYVLGEFEEIIPENEAGADMFDLLGTYFNGKLVSRALQNVIFGGVGITGKPADVEARIWACATNKSDEEYHTYLHEIYDGHRLSVMPRDLVIVEHEKVTAKLLNKKTEEE